MPVESKPRPARRAPARAAAATPAVVAPAAQVLAEAPAVLALPRPHGGWRILALALALVEPSAGLLLALLYWRGSELPVRRFSRWCLALAVLGILLSLAVTALKAGSGGAWQIQPY